MLTYRYALSALRFWEVFVGQVTVPADLLALSEPSNLPVTGNKH
jgi:hypothetical protein